MKTTLPTIEELKHMDLSSLTLYCIEVHHLLEYDAMTKQEKQALCVRARQGDREAQSYLLAVCLPAILRKAFAIYEERQPLHIDVLDLVEEANLKILKHMDTVLSTRSEPISYLMRVATNHMQHYCTYSAPLIQRPYGLSWKALTKRQQYHSVESLDAPILHKEKSMLHIDRIQAPAPTSKLDEERLAHRFSPLHEAVKSLPDTEQNIIVQFYGLFGEPARTSQELALEKQYRSYLSIDKLKRRGLRMLKQLLEPSFDTMIE